MHRRACEIGLKVGDTSIAAIHQQFLIVRQLYAGTNLLALKKELEHMKLKSLIITMDTQFSS